ncbi:methyl-accepting chemotaxis protein [Aquipluma nitroreducens]|uniref:Methyl-accepting chemotaxis protein n=1 Tax=Aquipluma nitroreducens TaxID=2010828 RepID=A0A5K7SGT6_9BACT|nr:hemerythrin family protein [Aquipluma nitroreducens]BBE20811.1 methyl-accepting chemotaxis protein [Aquipluma nitroreducens]
MDTTKKMTLWDQISIGNPEIDHDHKELFEIYNDLVDLIEFKKNRDNFAGILTKMTNYSLMHFKKEERYMKNLSFPKLNEHIKHHQKYIYNVAMYNAELLGINPPDPEEIITFLKNWWINHILKIDIQYEQFKKENAINSDY